MSDVPEVVAFYDCACGEEIVLMTKQLAFSREWVIWAAHHGFKLSRYYEIMCVKDAEMRTAVSIYDEVAKFFRQIRSFEYCAWGGKR